MRIIRIADMMEEGSCRICHINDWWKGLGSCWNDGDWMRMMGLHGDNIH